jgi:hypothetical protein
MGQAFDMLAKGMREALETLKKFGPHKGLPTVRDVPVLIRALSMRSRGPVAEEAHAALVWLAGKDLGREAPAWQEWWEREGAALVRREDQAAAARRAFLEVKRAVLTGRWNEIHAALRAELRRELSPVELSRQTICTTPALRGVYRDASVREVILDEEAGRLVVDWGGLGFDFEEIGLVREEDGWKLGRVPWSEKLVRRRVEVTATPLCERPESFPARHSAGRRPSGAATLPRRRRRFRLFGRGLLGDALVVLLCLAPLGLCYFWPPLLLVLLVAAVPAVLFWVLIFGRLRSSREILAEVHRRRRE